MKSIATSVLFVFIALSSAAAGVSALLSAKQGTPDLLHCRYRGMLTEGLDSTGALAWDSNSGDASSAAAGTRVVLRL